MKEHRPDLMSDVPSSWAMVEFHCRVFGGWSKYFARSGETIDKEVIIVRQGDPDFYLRMERALMEAQFREAIESGIKEFRTCFPEKKIKKRDLFDKIAVALLESGWKPSQKPILEAIRKSKRERKMEILALRGGLTKKEWKKKLNSKKKEK
jgi:hypothetical protein